MSTSVGWESFSLAENGNFHRMIRIRRAGFLNNMIRSINFIMPWTSVPMVVASEIEDAFAFDVQGHVPIVCELIKKMAGVSAFILPLAIVSAAHVSADTNPLLRP